MSEPHGKNCEMASLTQQLTNENKHKRKKKRISEDANTTTRLQKHGNSYCNLTNVSIEYLFRHCYFSHHAKSTPLFVYYGFQDKSYRGG